jgi:uncharacterized protein (TIGR03067 family)
MACHITRPVCLAAALIASGPFFCGCGGPITSATQSNPADATPPRPATEADIKKALEDLQGTWDITRRVTEGNERTEKGLATYIENDRMTIKKPGLADDVYKISVDPAPKPSRIELAYERAPVKFQAIYELVGDELKVHISSFGATPKDFQPRKDTELLVMTRASKKKPHRWTTVES